MPDPGQHSEIHKHVDRGRTAIARKRADTSDDVSSPRFPVALVCLRYGAAVRARVDFALSVHVVAPSRPAAARNGRSASDVPLAAFAPPRAVRQGGRRTGIGCRTAVEWSRGVERQASRNSARTGRAVFLNGVPLNTRRRAARHSASIPAPATTNSERYPERFEHLAVPFVVPVTESAVRRGAGHHATRCGGEFGVLPTDRRRTVRDEADRRSRTADRAPRTGAGSAELPLPGRQFARCGRAGPRWAGDRGQRVLPQERSRPWFTRTGRRPAEEIV